MSDDLKKQAALAALDEIRNGMIVGLGTGSTAAHFIRALGSRARDGLKVVGIPTSEDSARLAKEAGVPLTTFRDHPEIDVTVDGDAGLDFRWSNRINQQVGVTVNYPGQQCCAAQIDCLKAGRRLRLHLRRRTDLLDLAAFNQHGGG